MDLKKRISLIATSSNKSGVFLQTILIFSAYSCGSSALAGFFERCGAHSCPPHAWSNDERTKISFENIHLKRILETMFPLKKEKEKKKRFLQKKDAQELIDFFPWLDSNTHANRCRHRKKSHRDKTSLNHVCDQRDRAFSYKPSLHCFKKTVEEIENSRLRRKWNRFMEKKEQQLFMTKKSQMRQSN